MNHIVMLGRTGNNLFQYAFGRALQEKHQVPFLLDGAWFNLAGWQNVSCLKRLPILAELKYDFSIAARLLVKATGKHFLDYSKRPQLNEPLVDHRFNPSYLEVPDNSFIRGYFQSPLYFQSIEKKLRKELSMDGISWQNQTHEMARKLQLQGSVAVHIRRTDYVGNPNVAVCGSDYYQQAMVRLRSRMIGLHFYLFSDDPKWCSEHFVGDDVTVCALKEAEGDPLHDLYLMSCANHHIICNSTYSWWAAWLGKNPIQQVIMPHEWYATDIIAPIEEKKISGWEIFKPTKDEF